MQQPLQMALLQLVQQVRFLPQQAQDYNGTTLAAGGVTSVSQAAPSASTGSPQTIAPTTGAVVVTPHTYAGGANVGYVPAGGTATTVLAGDGTWTSNGPMHMVTKEVGAIRMSGSANDYYTRHRYDQSTPTWSIGTLNSLGTSSPNALGAGMTAANHLAGLFFINPGVGGSGVTTDDMEFMAISVSFTSTLDVFTAGVTFEFELWKTAECVKGTYARAWHGSGVVNTAGDIVCQDLTSVGGGTEKLEPATAYFLTVNVNQATTNDDFQANISAAIRYTQ